MLGTNSELILSFDVVALDKSQPSGNANLDFAGDTIRHRLRDVKFTFKLFVRDEEEIASLIEGKPHPPFKFALGSSSFQSPQRIQLYFDLSSINDLSLSIYTEHHQQTRLIGGKKYDVQCWSYTVVQESSHKTPPFFSPPNSNWIFMLQGNCSRQNLSYPFHITITALLSPSKSLSLPREVLFHLADLVKVAPSFQPEIEIVEESQQSKNFNSWLRVCKDWNGVFKNFVGIQARLLLNVPTLNFRDLQPGVPMKDWIRVLYDFQKFPERLNVARFQFHFGDDSGDLKTAMNLLPIIGGLLNRLSVPVQIHFHSERGMFEWAQVVNILETIQIRNGIADSVDFGGTFHCFMGPVKTLKTTKKQETGNNSFSGLFINRASGISFQRLRHYIGDNLQSLQISDFLTTDLTPHDLEDFMQTFDHSSLRFLSLSLFPYDSSLNFWPDQSSLISSEKLFVGLKNIRVIFIDGGLSGPQLINIKSLYMFSQLPFLNRVYFHFCVDTATVVPEHLLEVFGDHRFDSLRYLEISVLFGDSNWLDERVELMSKTLGRLKSELVRNFVSGWEEVGYR